MNYREFVINNVKINGKLKPIDKIFNKVNHFPDGILPDSYVDYLSYFGVGAWEPELLICAPGMAEKNQSIDYSQYLYLANVDRLIANGHHKFSKMVCIGMQTIYKLCFDTRRSSGTELGLCLVCAEGDYIKPCGDSIWEFLAKYWIDGEIDLITQDEWYSKPIFHPCR